MSRSHVIDVRTSNINKVKTSYCGKAIAMFDFSFVDPTHAISSIQANSYAQPCNDCIKSMISILNEGSE